MAKHELVCVREFVVPEQVLGPMRVSSICTGADMGVIPGSEITIPARTYRVGAQASFSKKSDALRWIKTGNWEYAR